MLTYRESYVTHCKPFAETRARGRRLKAFKSASHLQEVLTNESPKHQNICQTVWTKTKARLDHTSFWTLGTMAAVLTEPCNVNLEDFDCDDLHVVEVPTNIALYCGYWDETLGVEPRTKSFLITSILKKRQLEEVLRRLEEAAKSMPRWNQIGEDKA